jgi:hypothetical protein
MKEYTRNSRIPQPGPLAERIANVREKLSPDGLSTHWLVATPGGLAMIPITEENLEILRGCLAALETEAATWEH